MTTQAPVSKSSTNRAPEKEVELTLNSHKINSDKISSDKMNSDSASVKPVIKNDPTPMRANSGVSTMSSATPSPTVTPVVETKKTSPAAITKSAATKSSTTKQQSESAQVSCEEIAMRAYEIWQAEGCPEGRDQANWIQAELELKAKYATREQ